jgi:hypothetical protein
LRIRTRKKLLTGRESSPRGQIRMISRMRKAASDVGGRRNNKISRDTPKH